MGDARMVSMPVTREATAYHEAGHALMYEAHYLGVEKVTIKGTNAAAGMVYFRDHLGSALLSGGAMETALARSIAVSRARVCLAGFEAEKKYRGIRLVGIIGGDDGEKAFAYAMVGYSTDLLGASLVLHRERQWVRRYLHRHWAHVEAVASLLLKRGTVSGTQVRRALDGVGPYRRVAMKVSKGKA